MITSFVLLVALTPTSSIAARSKVSATADDTWSPDFTHITEGNVIVWKNPDSRFHDLTSYGRNWSLEHGLPPGESVSKRFRHRGVYKFRCRIHSAIDNGTCDGMCGVIHVTR
ncbi:MAG: Cupredoxin-like domain [Actinomycetota bacterium]|jgi:plastocyanin|nr:Cupredoxin-like domain [Actinomycetota bacterium]